MISHFYRTKSDIENLSRKRTILTPTEKNPDYRGVVVQKPWGYEYLMYENKYVGIWVLHINKGHSTSMHCHPAKKTSLIVLSGKVRSSVLEGWMDRIAGEGIVIDKGVFHTTKALSEGGATIMEIETPPDKRDLVRLKDEYGREHEGYEGADKLNQSTDSFEYIHFLDLKSKRKLSKTIGQCVLSLGHLRSGVKIHSTAAGDHVFCPLQGFLLDKRTKTTVSVGEAVVIDRISKLMYKAATKIQYLSIRRRI